MSDEIHVGDEGTQFRITVKESGVALDISTASDMVINIRKPSNTLLSVAGDFLTDGTDGVLTYTTVAGDLDEVGTYKIEAVVSIDGGVFTSSSASFKVHHNV
jgi:hypothetical protein